MKISDSQIFSIFEKKNIYLGNNPGSDFFVALRELIALAQQVKPLEWVEVSDALKVVKKDGEYKQFNGGV